MPLIKAGLAHRGAAFIDVISPCVAFNNHDGSTKSYDYIREHNEAVNRLDFWPSREAIRVDDARAEVMELTQHDGSVLRLRRIRPEFDPGDRVRAMNQILEHAARGEVLTGLLYLDAEAEDLHAHLSTDRRPLNRLEADELCPGKIALERINASLR